MGRRCFAYKKKLFVKKYFSKRHMARRLNKNNFVRFIVHVFFGPTEIHCANNGLNNAQKTWITKQIAFSKRRPILGPYYRVISTKPIELKTSYFLAPLN